MKNSTKKVNLGLAGLVLTGSLFMFGSSFKSGIDYQREFKRNPYVTSYNSLESATNSLLFTPKYSKGRTGQPLIDIIFKKDIPEEYPNPNNARYEIKRVLESDLLDKDSENVLRTVYEKLPISDSLKEYQGNIVNQETFEQERNYLNTISEKLFKTNKDKIEDQKNKAIIKTIGFGFLSLFSLGILMNLYEDFKRKN